MQKLSRLLTCVACWTAVIAPARAEAPETRPSGDNVLEAAADLVRRSDRYLHQDKLRRGMKGYGLTVLSGTKIVRFDAEIVSVVKQWSLHQDVILARLSGQGLEKTGIIAGMSGSPVYVEDPADGKDKLIGAVAYGWTMQKEALCGIQPIAQMLAIHVAENRAEGGVKKASVGNAGELLPASMNPRKTDFARLVLSNRPARRPAGAANGLRLVPLATPLTVSGAGARRLSELAEMLEPAGLIPVSSGGVGGMEEAAARDVRLEPGAAVAISLVTGDADWSASGTVTDVFGKRVLALGHAFLAEGETAMPMATAYIHTPVASISRSFKVTSTLKIAGAVTSDEYTGIAGAIGEKAPMFPMTVTVNRARDGRREVFRYNVCRHRIMTPYAVGMLVGESAFVWRDLPERHTVSYSVEVDYDKLGTYRAGNISSGTSVAWASSDASRPVGVLVNNPFGPPPKIKSISANITIHPGDISARIIDMKLDGALYRPGDTVTGKVTVRRFRKERATIAFSFPLPDDLPDGAYELTACDWLTSTDQLTGEMPHRFAPLTVEELFASVQRLVEARADRLYLRLPVPRGGMALGQKELPDLPEGKAVLLRDARLIDARAFTRTIVRTQPSEYVIEGAAKASFEVRRDVDETLIRKSGKE